MAEGWRCPNCGKAHAPSVMTCPEPASALYPPNGLPDKKLLARPYGPFPARFKLGSGMWVNPAPDASVPRMVDYDPSKPTSGMMLCKGSNNA